MVDTKLLTSAMKYVCWSFWSWLNLFSFPWELDMKFTSKISQPYKKITLGFWLITYVVYHRIDFAHLLYMVAEYDCITHISLKKYVSQHQHDISSIDIITQIMREQNDETLHGQYFQIHFCDWKLAGFFSFYLTKVHYSLFLGSSADNTSA